MRQEKWSSLSLLLPSAGIAYTNLCLLTHSLAQVVCWQLLRYPCTTLDRTGGSSTGFWYLCLLVSFLFVLPSCAVDGYGCEINASTAPLTAEYPHGCTPFLMHTSRLRGLLRCPHPAGVHLELVWIPWYVGASFTTHCLLSCPFGRLWCTYAG